MLEDVWADLATFTVLDQLDQLLSDSLGVSWEKVHVEHLVLVDEFSEVVDCGGCDCLLAVSHALS